MIVKRWPFRVQCPYTARSRSPAGVLGHSQAGGDSVLLAISDGASSTIYAGPWARSLVAEAQLDWPSLDDETLTTKMDAARERSRAAYPADLPWYIAHKLTKEGSQA